MLIAWDALWGVLAGAAMWMVIGPGDDSLLAIGLALAGGGVAIVAVLATVVTLVSVLFESDAFEALIDRLGGRQVAMFPYWFHGYLGALVIASGLLGAAAESRFLITAASGGLVWAGFGMVDLTRQALRYGLFRRRVDGAVQRARRNSA